METPGEDNPYDTPDPWRPPIPPSVPAVPPHQLGQPDVPPPYWQPQPATLPPPPPLPPTRRPLSAMGRLRVLGAWCSIAVLSLVAIIVQAEMAKQVPSDPIATTRPNTQFTMQAKFAVFLDRQSLGQSGMGLSPADQAFNDAEMLAMNSHDLVRLVILRGEVYGNDDALRMIDDLRVPGMYSVDLTAGDDEDLDLLLHVYTGKTLTPAEADRLENRHLWFGELATTYNEPTTTRAYRRLRGSGLWLLLGLGLLCTIFVIMGITGFVLMIVGLVKLSAGSITLRFFAELKPREAPPLLEAVALFLLFFVLTGVISLFAPEPVAALMALLGLGVIALCALLPLLFGIGWRRYREVVGLHCGRGLFKEIGCGAVGYLAGMPLIVVGFAISFVLFFLATAINPPDPDLPFFDPIAGLGPVMLIALILMLVVWAPIVEELIFRGYFYAHCRRWMPWPVSGLVVGVVFAAIHPQGIWFVPGLASVGFVLAAIREWRGSIIGSMTAHAIHNGLVATAITIITLT